MQFDEIPRDIGQRLRVVDALARSRLRNLCFSTKIQIISNFFLSKLGFFKVKILIFGHSSLNVQFLGKKKQKKKTIVLVITGYNSVDIRID